MKGTLGVVGVGNIARAVVTGLCTAPDPPDAVVVSPRGREHATALAERFDRVTVAESNQAVVDASDRLLLGLRTQDARAAVGEITLEERQPVISLMSPIGDGWLHEALAPGGLEARVLALPANAQHTGPLVICPAGTRAEPLFAQLGTLLSVTDPEELLTLFALSSWAAPVYTAIGSAVGWAAGHGLDPDVSRRYWVAVLASFLDPAGAEDAPPLDALIAEAATTGGLNEQVLEHLTEAGVFDEIPAVLEAVRARLAQ